MVPMQSVDDVGVEEGLFDQVEGDFCCLLVGFSNHGMLGNDSIIFVHKSHSLVVLFNNGIFHHNIAGLVGLSGGN